MDYKPLVTLLAIVNPLAIVPFFIHYTQGYSAEERRRTIWIASCSAFCVIAISALLGLRILDFFSISLASFQVGGGMLLLTSSLAMLNAEPAEAKSTINEIKEEIKEAQTDSMLLAEQASAGANAKPSIKSSAARAHDRDQHAVSAARTSIAVVPLTIPLLTGPATMSTVVIYAEKAKTVPQLATLVGYGLVIALATALCFAAAQPIARLLGKTGINVMTRLMGLILAALSVEVMSEGLIKLFPMLGR
jgi:multiple antibiotic resistance protein